MNPLKIQEIIEEKRLVYGMRLEKFLIGKVNIFFKKTDEVISSKSFCLYSVLFIFLLSIFLRSTIDIGHDSGFYLKLAEEFASGGKYYYDLFESNFPLSFLLHLIPYYISKISGFSVIIIAEYYINILAILSIFYSHKILQKADFSSGQRNIITTAFALGFFLRIGTLESNEFLTKTSFYLIIAFPYIAYSFHRIKPLSNQNLLFRGILAGLMPCLKPHYIILPAIIEICRFWRQKDLRFFIQIDKLMMVAVGCCYLVYMINFHPEFFIYMVPMWSSIYGGFIAKVFLLNLSIQLFDNIIAITIFLFFLHQKFTQQDKILLQIFIAISVIVVLEGLPAARDQHACFKAIALMIICKISYDFAKSNIHQLKKYSFPVLSLFVISLFDEKLGFFRSATLYFWIIYVPILSFILYRAVSKDSHVKFGFDKILILLAIIGSFLVLAGYGIYLSSVNNNAYIILSFCVFISFVSCYEKIYLKSFDKVSPLFIFLISLIFIGTISAYIHNISKPVKRIKLSGTKDNYSEKLMQYSDIYLKKSDDKILFIMQDLPDAFPAINYFDFDFNNKVRTEYLFTNITKPAHNSKNKELSREFTINYILDNLKNEIKNSNNKIIAININDLYQNKSADFCSVNFLEYYFKDNEFKKLFFENYEYLGNFIQDREYDNQSDVKFLAQEEHGFESVILTKKYLRYNTEFYIRKEKHEE